MKSETELLGHPELALQSKQNWFQNAKIFIQST